MRLRAIFLLTSLILAPTLVSADLMSHDEHRVRRCIKIVNLDKFPDLALVGFYAGVGGNKDKKYEAYQIKNDECLTKGYKFNKLDIYWTTQKKFVAMNLDNLAIKIKKEPSGYDRNGKTAYYDVYSPKNLELLAEKVESQDTTANNTNRLIKETIEYSLEKNLFGELRWYKSRRITEYNDGSQQKIETFQPSDTAVNSSSTSVSSPETKPARSRGFWHSVFCFLKISSANNCR